MARERYRRSSSHSVGWRSPQRNEGLRRRQAKPAFIDLLMAHRDEKGSRTCPCWVEMGGSRPEGHDQLAERSSRTATTMSGMRF
jgi:hypothetical protein